MNTECLSIYRGILLNFSQQYFVVLFFFFLVYKSFTSLVKFIPNYFILFFFSNAATFFFFSFIFISWRLITLQYCSGDMNQAWIVLFGTIANETFLNFLF